MMTPTRTRTILMTFYENLLERFGPQDWWPADSPFEVMVGAILTQNTAWSNVEKAIIRLKNAHALSPRVILDLPNEELAELIRPSGYFNLKANRLKAYVQWFLEKHHGNEPRLRAMPCGDIRNDLLTVCGVGPETADSILLYAFDQPTFVVDAYTRRIFHRLGVCEEKESYASLREIFMKHLPENIALYNEYHALIVALGKDFCRPRPRCEDCPVRKMSHRHGFG